MAKLLGSIVEQAISQWAESNHKRAKGQAGFRPKHSTIDHLITLRILMEESRLKGNHLHCCFVDFTKAFDTIPRDGLWQRMEQIEVPKHLRLAVAQLYKQVRCQLKTQNGLSKEFYSNMGVKQGCPLSSTLFGLYIDEITSFIDRFGGKGSPIASLMIQILLYANDIVLLSSSTEGVQQHLDALEEFCLDRDLSVNLGKTKIMVFNTSPAALLRLSQPTSPFLYRGQPIEIVQPYTYLGAMLTG